MQIKKSRVTPAKYKSIKITLKMSSKDNDNSLRYNRFDLLCYKEGVSCHQFCVLLGGNLYVLHKGLFGCMACNAHYGY